MRNCSKEVKEEPGYTEVLLKKKKNVVIQQKITANLRLANKDY